MKDTQLFKVIVCYADNRSIYLCKNTAFILYFLLFVSYCVNFICVLSTSGPKVFVSYYHHFVSIVISCGVGIVVHFCKTT